MTTRPRISVLIPCHNAAPFVGEALESVLAQDWPDLEVIVVDDGSTDGSAGIVSPFEGRGVMLVRQQKSGAASARNAAFAASSGSAVLYLDADDVIGPAHLSALAARLDGDRAIAMSRWDRFYGSPEDATCADRQSYRDASGPEWLAAEWTGGAPMMQSGMLLVPRALVTENGGWDERLSLDDDFEFCARIIARSDGIRFAEQARLFYRSGHGNTLSSARSREAVESQALSLLLGTQHLLDAEDTPRTRRACANILQSFDFGHYPRHPDLRARLRRRAAALGGADIDPVGPPRFHTLRRLVGWRAARRVQRALGR